MPLNGPNKPSKKPQLDKLSKIPLSVRALITSLLLATASGEARADDFESSDANAYTSEFEDSRWAKRRAFIPKVLLEQADDELEGEGDATEGEATSEKKGDSTPEADKKPPETALESPEIESLMSILWENYLNPSIYEKGEAASKSLELVIQHPEHFLYLEEGDTIRITKHPNAPNEIPDGFEILLKENSITHIFGIEIAPEGADEWSRVPEKYKEYSHEIDEYVEKLFNDEEVDPPPKEHRAYVSDIRFGMIERIVQLHDKVDTSGDKALTDYFASEGYTAFREWAKKHEIGDDKLIISVKMFDDVMVIRVIGTEETGDWDVEVMAAFNKYGEPVEEDGDGKFNVVGEGFKHKIDPSKLLKPPETPPKRPVAEAKPAESTEQKAKRKRQAETVKTILSQSDDWIFDEEETELNNVENKRKIADVMRMLNAVEGADATVLNDEGEVTVMINNNGERWVGTGKGSSKTAALDDALDHMENKGYAKKKKKTYTEEEKAEGGKASEAFMDDPTGFIDSLTVEDLAKFDDRIDPNDQDTKDLLAKVKSVSKKRWVKDGLNKMKQDMENGTFELPEPTASSIVPFLWNYFPKSPESIWDSGVIIALVGKVFL